MGLDLHPTLGLEETIRTISEIAFTLRAMVNMMLVSTSSKTIK